MPVGVRYSDALYHSGFVSIGYTTNTGEGAPVARNNVLLPWNVASPQPPLRFKPYTSVHNFSSIVAPGDIWAQTNVGGTSSLWYYDGIQLCDLSSMDFRRPLGSGPLTLWASGTAGGTYLFELLTFNEDVDPASAHFTILNQFNGNLPTSNYMYFDSYVSASGTHRMLTLRGDGRVSTDYTLSAGVVSAGTYTSPNLQHLYIPVGAFSPSNNSTVFNITDGIKLAVGHGHRMYASLNLPGGSIIPAYGMFVLADTLGFQGNTYINLWEQEYSVGGCTTQTQLHGIAVTGSAGVRRFTSGWTGVTTNATHMNYLQIEGDVVVGGHSIYGIHIQYYLPDYGA